MKSMITVAILATICVLPIRAADPERPCTGSGDWLWQHPVPQGNTLRAAALGPESLIAAGDYGTLVRFHRKTRTWQHVASPTQEHLKAIAPASATTWVAVGAAGTILRSTDSGSNWTARESGTNEDLYGLAFGGPDVGAAVGSGGIILVTQDGGQSWARRGSDVNLTLRAITFLNPREAVVVGESGVILKTDDAGMNWKQQTVAANLYFIASRGDNLIAVGGEVGYFRNRRVVFGSADRGNNWKMEVDESGPVLYGVSIGADMTAIACGESGTLLQRAGRNSAWTKAKSPTKHLLTAVVDTEDEFVAVGSFGIVATSTEGGKSWTANFAKKRKQLTSISFYDAGHGVAVGQEGLILYTADGGGVWHRSKSGFKAGLSGVAMLSLAEAVAVGSDGLVLQTTNGGESWKAVASGTDKSLGAVDFADGHSGLAVGWSTILATDDGGNTWERRSIPDGVGDCWLADVAYADHSLVAIVGSTGVILTSSDGGGNWSSVRSGTTQNLRSIAWSDPRHATAVGDKGIILRSEDGGLTWAATPSGTEQKLSGIAYINSREGVAGGESGILLYTGDGGRTWTPERSHTHNHLRSVFCRAGTSVFATGWNATILRREPSRPVEHR
ncbi:MAG: hypothetical protein IH897_01720 [Planctomycetes bacterium]|nr:hypothetical protein [Planctomycetota bacterium]